MGVVMLGRIVTSLCEMCGDNLPVNVVLIADRRHEVCDFCLYPSLEEEA